MIDSHEFSLALVELCDILLVNFLHQLDLGIGEFARRKEASCSECLLRLVY